MEKVENSFMDVILPPSLKRGDTIGIVSPSDPIISTTEQQLNKGIDFLKEQGFKVELSRNVLNNTLGYSATAEERRH